MPGYIKVRLVFADCVRRLAQRSGAIVPPVSTPPPAEEDCEEGKLPKTGSRKPRGNTEGQGGGPEEEAAQEEGCHAHQPVVPA